MAKVQRENQELKQELDEREADRQTMEKKFEIVEREIEEIGFQLKEQARVNQELKKRAVVEVNKVQKEAEGKVQQIRSKVEEERLKS